MSSKWYINKSGELVDFGEGLCKVSVSYSKGGFSYYTYKQERREYYVHVTFGVTRSVSDSGQFVSESMTMFSGFKVCLREVKRASARTEAEVCKVVEDSLAKIAAIVGSGRDEKSTGDEIGTVLLALAA